MITSVTTKSYGERSFSYITPTLWNTPDFLGLPSGQYLETEADLFQKDTVLTVDTWTVTEGVELVIGESEALFPSDTKLSKWRK